MACIGCPGFFLSEFLPPSEKPCHRAENRSEFPFRNATFCIHALLNYFIAKYVLLQPSASSKGKDPKVYFGGEPSLSCHPSKSPCIHQSQIHLAQPHKKKSSEVAAGAFHILEILHDISIIEKPHKTNENFNPWHGSTCRVLWHFCWAYSNSKTSGLIKGFTSNVNTKILLNDGHHGDSHCQDISEKYIYTYI